ncbi:MAG: signal peptidase I [Bacilli bacterium]|nr:signal peptidase I [Bacilli bacterium]
MKTSHKKALAILMFIALVSIVNFFFPFILDSNRHLILLGLVLVILYLLLGIDIKGKSNNRLIIRDILIYITFYYLLIYLLGLLTGFVRTIYSYTISNLVINIIPSILTIFGVELIRNQLINKTNKKKIIVVLSCIVFILFEISINFQYYNLTIKDEIYLFIGLLVASSISKNILMTVIAMKTDYLPAVVYRLLIETLDFVVLIQPDLGPYLNSVVAIMLPILTAIMLINMGKKVKDTPEKVKKGSKFYIVLVIILSILVLLNSGLLKFQTLVIGSQSMLPMIDKGDVVLIERLNKEEKDKVKLGEILVYRYDNKIICHRVVKVSKRDNGTFYKTKGDNNDQDDKIVLSRKEVMGKVIYRIKYIGLPSVWLNELFN